MSSLKQFFDENADILADLTPRERGALISAITSCAIEGFQPTRTDLAALADRARGTVSFHVYLERVGVLQHLKHPELLE